jgi:ABC-type branched-subunit amino acid transport system substrate-binding protein
MKKQRVAVLMGIVFAIALGMASSAQTPGVTDTTINLGAFIAQSGALATIGIPVAHGAPAWYNYVNDEWGGIYGRKINFIPYDDVFNPANTVAGVKKLVEQDGIFALVNSLGTTGFQAVRDYLVANGVPVVSPHANWISLAPPVAFGTVTGRRPPARSCTSPSGPPPLHRTGSPR